MILLLLLSQLSFGCEPERQFIKFPHMGIYHRVHPKGTFVLYTGGKDNDTAIVDLRDKAKPVELPTALSVEVFPVEINGEWRVLSSASKKNGMEYFWFDDVLKNGKKARPFFVDSKHGSLYQSSAALEGSTDKELIVRTYSFDTRKTKDYRFEAGKRGGRVLGERYACRNFAGAKIQEESLPSAKQKALKEIKNKVEALHREYQKLKVGGPVLDTFRERLTKLVREMDLIRYGAEHEEIRKKILEEREKKVQDAALIAELENDLADLEGSPIAQPVLSKDGKYLAGSNKNGRIYVYKLLPNGSCEILAKTKYPGEKVAFSSAVSGASPQIVFTADGLSNGKPGRKIVIFHTGTGKSIVYAPPEGENANYPGFTADGNVIYSTGTGFVVLNFSHAPGCSAL